MTDGGYTAEHAARLQTFAPNPRDLETIVTLFEVSALCLTDEPGRTFTKRALFKQAHDLEPEMQRRDMEIVFAGMSKTFARVGRNFTLR